MKIFSLFLVFLVLILLCGCSLKNSDTILKDPNLQLPNIEELERPNKVEDVFKDIEFNGVFLNEYADVDSFDVNKFLGSAIYYLSCGKDIAYPIPIIPGYDNYEDIILKLMHLRKEYLQYYAISVSMEQDNIYTFAIVRANSDYIDNVYYAFNQRLFDMETVANYYPEYKDMFENYVYEQLGSFIVLIICEDSESVLEDLYNVMKSGDLTEIVHSVT